MRKRQVRRKLANNSDEIVFTWIFNDSKTRLFSAAENYTDGHGANFAISKHILDKDKSLTIDLRIISKGGKSFEGSCKIEKESISELINILNAQLSIMNSFERENDELLIS